MSFLLCSEKASLAVTLVNANNEVMGHAAFFDYPNVTSLDPAKWEEWLHSKYNCKCNVSIPFVLHEQYHEKIEFSYLCKRLDQTQIPFISK